MGLVRKLSRYSPFLFRHLGKLPIELKAFIKLLRCVPNDIFEEKIWPYLDNFVTYPYTFLAYSGETDPESPEYHKIW